MKKTIKALTVILSISIFCISLFLTLVNVSASSLTDELMTRIYAKSEEGYYNGCEDYDNYKNQSAQITVLTHGYGSEPYHWSNNGLTEQLAYNPDSVISRIARLNNLSLDVYVASLDEDELALEKYDQELNSQGQVSHITNTNKHIVVIFDSANPEGSNNDVYQEFNKIIDKVSLQYKMLNGQLPRLNLIGHSRGGLTNLEYAINHPYNICSIYSIGTPYNGSKLGESDLIMTELLDFTKDKDGKYDDGVEDILNQSESIRLRDAWNNTYDNMDTYAKSRLDARAFAGATSISYLNAFISDADTHGYDIPDWVITTVNYITAVIETLPRTSGNLLDQIQILSDIGYIATDAANELCQAYNGLADFINEKFNGDLKKVPDFSQIPDVCDDVHRIIDLYTVVNSKPVIMDDLFIDVDSQFGYWDNGNNLKGFNRLLNIFEDRDIIGASRSEPNQPAVVHNLEASSNFFTKAVAVNLSFATKNSTVIEKTDCFNLQNENTSSNIIHYKPAYTGTREITSSCGYDIFYENGQTVPPTGYKTYWFNRNQTYYIVLNKNINEKVSFSADATYINTTTTVRINPRDQVLYKVNSSSYKLLSTNNSNVRIKDLNGNVINKLHFNTNEDKYVVFENTSNNYQIFKLQINDPAHYDDECNISFNSGDMISFTNTTSASQSYIVTLSKSSNIHLYYSNGTEISIPVTLEGSSEKNFTFDVASKQTIYVQFEGSGNLNISKTDKLYWKVNNQLITNENNYTYNVVVGKPYTVELVLIKNNIETTIQTGYYQIFDTNNVIKERSFTIQPGTMKIGSTFNYSHTLYPTKALFMKVVPDNNYLFSVENEEQITIKCEKTLSSKDTIDSISFLVTYRYDNATFQYTVPLNQKGALNASFTIPSNYMSSLKENCTVTINSIYINDEHYHPNNITTTFNGFFKSGSGTDSDPYIVSSMRHFSNIKKYPYSTFKFESKTFDLNGNDWSTFSFYGKIDGSNSLIRNLRIVEPSGNAGFVSDNTGLIQNLNFAVSSIKLSSTSSEAYVGIIAGKNYGKIINCSLSFISVESKSIKGTVGCVAGFNCGTIDDTLVDGATLNVSGNAGGIAGSNSGKIRDCRVIECNISYIFSTPSGFSYSQYNGHVGGIAGVNNDYIANCYTAGEFSWNYNTKNENVYKNCDPCLGFIIGLEDKNGKHYSCSSSMKSKVNVSTYWSLWTGTLRITDNAFAKENGNVGSLPKC